MNQQAFDRIVSKLNGALEKQGYEKQKGIVEDEQGKSVWFLGETNAYRVGYNEAEKRFELSSTEMTDEGPDDEGWRSVSNWMFDGETDGLKEADSIANDFVDTVGGVSRQQALRLAKRKAGKDKDKEHNPGPVFFFKRLVPVFPELKEEINEELVAYASFRAVTFAREKVLPKVQAQAKKKGADATKKLATILEEMYKNGDLDVRSIITIVLLNGIESDEERENLLEHMSDSFRKYYRRALPYRHKKVRPEREKRARTPVSSDAPERLSGKIPKH